MSDNPFAVLTAVVAPAILTNACSVLALGTANRIARVVDRTHVILRELSTLDKKSARYKSRHVQIDRLRARSRFLLHALRIFYGALGGFAASAIVSIVGALSAYYDKEILFRVTVVVALMTGLSAVAALVIGCGLMVAEVRLALHVVDQEVDDALADDALADDGARPPL